MLSVRTLSALGALSLLAAMGAACDHPVAPGPQQPPPTPHPPPPVVSGATLAIEDPFVILRPNGSRDEYGIEVRFLLKETGGKTGAAIERIFLGKGRGGGESIGDPCIKGLRLPPGGVLDNFYTDEGVKRLSYCGPYLGTTAEPTLDFPVTVSVVFVDDEGRRGQVDARALVRPGENPAPSSAVLAIEDPFVLGGTTRFLLRETTGNSGATILNVLTGDGRGGADSTGPGCWGKVLRVPPGGMLDTFYTQEGADWLSYCGVWGGMFVTVRFADDTGRIGTVSAQVIVK